MKRRRRSRKACLATPAFLENDIISQKTFTGTDNEQASCSNAQQAQAQGDRADTPVDGDCAGRSRRRRGERTRLHRQRIHQGPRNRRGAPGVRSARYAGEPSDTPANNALLLRNLSGVTDRRANFTCAVALVDPQGREHSAVGKCFGNIAEAMSGTQGFGYDPLFVPDGYAKSFADLSAEEKNAISHRGRALAEVRRIMEGLA